MYHHAAGYLVYPFSQTTRSDPSNIQVRAAVADDRDSIIWQYPPLSHTGEFSHLRPSLGLKMPSSNAATVLSTVPPIQSPKASQFLASCFVISFSAQLFIQINIHLNFAFLYTEIIKCFVL